VADTIQIGGKRRTLGCIRSPKKDILKLRRVKDVVKLIPRELWKPWRYDEALPHTIYQDGVGECVATGTNHATMIGRFTAEPSIPQIELSAGALYSLINGGYDGGATITSGLEAMQSVGTCSAKTIGQLDWKKAAKNTAWREEAKGNRILESLYATTFDELMTLQQLRVPGVLGVAVTDAYERDDEDWLPDISERQARGVNHCIAAWGATTRTGTLPSGKRAADKWAIWSPSSWDDGWYAIPESYFKGTPAGEMFSVCVVTYPTNTGATTSSTTWTPALKKRRKLNKLLNMKPAETNS
jgi:hypothetical protein